MNTPMTIFSVVQILLIPISGVLQGIVPLLTRPELFFAVTVAPGFRASNDGRRILRRYRMILAVATVIALGVGAIGVTSEHPLLITVTIFAQLMASFAGFFRARRETIPHAVAPTTIREARLSDRDVPAPGGPLLQAGPFVLLGAMVIWLRAHWDSLPARIPTHFDLSGQAIAWTERSAVNVYGPLLSGLGMCLFLAALGQATARARRVHATGPTADAEARFRRTVLAVLLGGEYLAATTFVLVEVPVIGGPAWTLGLPAVLALAFLVIGVTALVRLGQGGSRRVGAEAAGPPVGDRTPDSAWKWGVFYMNPSDPALLVEKRFGIGYTLNFGHRAAWVIVVVPLLIPLLLVLARKTL